MRIKIKGVEPEYLGPSVTPKSEANSDIEEGSSASYFSLQEKPSATLEDLAEQWSLTLAALYQSEYSRGVVECFFAIL